MIEIKKSNIPSWFSPIITEFMSRKQKVYNLSKDDVDTNYNNLLKNLKYVNYKFLPPSMLAVFDPIKNGISLNRLMKKSEFTIDELSTYFHELGHAYDLVSDDSVVKKEKDTLYAKKVRYASNK